MPHFGDLMPHIAHIETPSVFVIKKENIEQGTRNVQYRSVGVRDLDLRCSQNFNIQNSLFNIRYSLQNFNISTPSVFYPFFRT